MWHPCSHLTTTDMGEKLGVVPLLGRRSGSPSNTFYKHNVAWIETYLRTKWYIDPSSRLATIHQRHRQTGQNGQRSDSIGRTVPTNGRTKMHSVDQKVYRFLQNVDDSENVRFLANVNSCSRSLYAVARPSVACLSVCRLSVCRL